MTELRTRIVAVVSSAEQAGDDRASLDEQIKRCRAAVTANGWREVAEPVRTVTSRDYYRLADLRAVSPAFDELCAQVERGDLDLIVGRDHSRVLGRTAALQAEVKTFLQLHRVQAFFYMRPVPPVPPARLGRRGAPQIGGDYVSAVVAVSDDEEIRRLVQRREEGMNKHASEGRWRHSGTPNGYLRPVVLSNDRRRVLGALAIDPSVAPHLRRAADLYLRGENTVTIAPLLSEWTGRPWSDSMVSKFLRNPFYAGVLVWGRSRADVVMAHGQIRRVRREEATTDRVIDLALAMLRGEDARTPEERDAGLIVARGDWEPLFDARTWIAIQERRRGRTGDRRDWRNKHLLSGIAVCDYCGGPMFIVGHYYGWVTPKHPRNAARRVPIYGCGRHNADHHVCRSNRCRADHLYAQLFAQLRRMLTDDTMLARGIEANPARLASDGKLDELRGELQKSERATRQWDAAYEAGHLSLADWQARRDPHQRATARIQREIARIEAAQATVQPLPERLAALRAISGKLENEAANYPRQLREQLIHLLAEVRIREKRIVRIALR